VTYCHQSVCVSQKPHIRTLPNFVCMLPVAVTRSSDDNYVMYSVLWMMSCFDVMEDRRHEYRTYNQRDSPGPAPGANSDVYDCLVNAASGHEHLILDLHSETVWLALLALQTLNMFVIHLAIHAQGRIDRNINCGRKNCRICCD